MERPRAVHGAAAWSTLGPPRHTRPCPFQQRLLVEGGGAKTTMEGVRWWMLVGRWFQGSTTVTKAADSLFWQQEPPSSVFCSDPHLHRLLCSTADTHDAPWGGGCFSFVHTTPFTCTSLHLYFTCSSLVFHLHFYKVISGLVFDNEISWKK